MGRMLISRQRRGHSGFPRTRISPCVFAVAGRWRGPTKTPGTGVARTTTSTGRLTRRNAARH